MSAALAWYSKFSMEREKLEPPRAQKREPASGDDPEPEASQRESFSTMVSGGGAPRVRLEASLSSAAAPPRPPVASSETASAASQVRPSPYASAPSLADDFEDVTPAPPPVLLTEQVGPSPPSSAGSVRLSLTGTGRNLRGVRVALADTDPTRTDAIAVALRARQAEVHVTSFECDRVHMRLLRKFAPHALLIDEAVLATIGRSFVEKLRSDPFLGHTQLFPLRFERMYKSRVGAASIETVREFLEPLGRAESELLARLGPHVEVEFELDQFPPHRLLRMLATRAAPTTIQCTREKEMLRWTVVRGRTGHAQLYRLGVDEPERLSADEALEWLLGHHNCYVVLTQPTEFDDKTGRDVIPMVERKESGLWDAPEPNASSKGSASGADSLSASLLSGRAEGSWLGASWLKSFRINTSLKGVLGVALGAAGAFSLTYLYGTHQAGKSAEARSGAVAAQLVDADSGSEPTQPSAPAPPSAPAGVSRPDAPSLPPGTKAAEQEAPAEEASPLFSVPAQHLEPCHKLAGQVKVPSSVKTPVEIARIAATHFRTAQRALVAGRSGEAHLALCRSALLDPAGPGTLLLVQFSLAQRDYETAAFWMKQVRDARPSELQVEELWGDVLHQSGKPEEALGVWLAAFGMEPEDTSKRVAVARRFAAHGATSLSSGDYPRAERALRRAFSFDPNSPLIARHLASVFARQGLTEQAERWRSYEVELVQAM